MGIKGLTQLIGDTCPEALKETEIKNHFDRKVAIDASMALYAFLISIRPDTGIWLTDEAGETTRFSLLFPSLPPSFLPSFLESGSLMGANRGRATRISYEAI